ncbi:protein N-lysine methyltransferase METTL21A [Microdochium nivale]|nr:protein N-lysine methyltransferase METTL21A [Microdochium nivale]
MCDKVPPRLCDCSAARRRSQLHKPIKIVTMGDAGPATRTFQIPTGDAESPNLQIRITEPALTAHGLPLTTWASAEILAGLMQTIDGAEIVFPARLDQSVVIPVLELGAGTGMVGVSAAVRWTQPAVLTDLSPIVPGIAANVALNKEILGDTRVHCGTLDWENPADFHLAQEDGPSLSPLATATKAHLILTADTCYSEEHPLLISKTVAHWLSRDDPGARAVICYALRVAYLDEIRELWSRLEDLGLESVADGQQRANSQIFDDECLCEWSVWRWKQGGVGGSGVA